MPTPMTVQVTVTPYGPEESDDNPGAYLQRCGEALLGAYDYSYTVMAAAGEGVTVRQLQITVPDVDAPSGKRAVMAAPPQIICDTNGSLEVLTPAEFDAKYGGA